MKTKTPNKNVNVRKENIENKILKSLKIENENLKRENEMIKNENKKLGKKIESLQKKLDKVNFTKDEEINKLIERCKTLNGEKKNSIDKLMLKLNKNVVEFRNYNGLPDGEKLIAVNFTSYDKVINHCIICKNKTKFFDIESELYRKYPKYKENENCFTLNNGLKINRWGTLEENKIYGYTIILNKIDNK